MTLLFTSEFLSELPAEFILQLRATDKFRTVSRLLHQFRLGEIVDIDELVDSVGDYALNMAVTAETELPSHMRPALRDLRRRKTRVVVKASLQSIGLGLLSMFPSFLGAPTDIIGPAAGAAALVSVALNANREITDVNAAVRETFIEVAKSPTELPFRGIIEGETLHRWASKDAKINEVGDRESSLRTRINPRSPTQSDL